MALGTPEEAARVGPYHKKSEGQESLKEQIEEVNESSVPAAKQM